MATRSEPTSLDSSEPTSGSDVPSVTVCRAEAQAGPLVSTLIASGYDVVSLPLLEIVPPPDRGIALAVAANEPGRFGWVAFTSTNAVAAYFAALEQPPSGTRFAAVGSATARALDAAGYPADHVAPEATAADLAATIPVASTDRVLAPLGVLANDDLIAGLDGRGIDCERVDAYATAVPTHSDDVVSMALGADVVLLTAPSVVDRLVELADGRTIPPGICIGPRTERRAEWRGLDVLDLADPHDDDGLVASVRRAFPTNPASS